MGTRTTQQTMGSIHLLDEIPLTLPETVLLRSLRLPDVRAIDEIPDPSLRRDIWRSVHKGLQLAKPRAVARWLELPRGAGVTQLDSLEFFESQTMVQWLDRCVKVTVMAVTIGDALADEVEQLRDKSLADAYHLDTVGGTLVGAVADTVTADVSRAIRKAGYGPTDTLLPEDAGGPPDLLVPLLERCGADRIDIRVGEDGELKPARSVVSLVGWRALEGEPL